ncbi:MAG: hypothetical protein GYB20_05930 [Oceanospirillales bacterium]|nr:hypothetical protein [Oceanospirillales bacterium]MBR9887215.1 hypothetical protein [Oceanospirillales bacterium]
MINIACAARSEMAIQLIMPLNLERMRSTQPGKSTVSTERPAVTGGTVERWNGGTVKILSDSRHPAVARAGPSEYSGQFLNRQGSAGRGQ